MFFAFSKDMSEIKKTVIQAKNQTELPEGYEFVPAEEYGAEDSPVPPGLLYYSTAQEGWASHAAGSSQVIWWTKWAVYIRKKAEELKNKFGRRRSFAFFKH